MTLVWVTFLLGFGVLFGMGALVVDLGYGMVQVRTMQNAADAGAIAAARLLAASVGQGPTAGTTAYVSITDGMVHARAREFATANSGAGGNGVSYTRAVEYRPCPGLASGSPNFTASSDAAIASEASGTRQSAATAPVPSWTCSVRVHARATFDSFFAGAIGRPTQASTARATPESTRPSARRSSRLLADHALAATRDRLSLQPRWFQHALQVLGSQSSSDGSWNGLVDMSRLSEVNKKTREQLFWCGGDGPILPNPPATPACHDPTYPGNNGKTVDVPNWARNGWRGQRTWMPAMRAADRGPRRCCAAIVDSKSIPGTSTSEIDNAMKDFITNNRIGTAPGSLGDYADVTVVLWDYAEQAVNTSTNVGTVWSSGSSNKIDRMMIAEARRFRFYVGHIGNGAAAIRYPLRPTARPRTGRRAAWPTPWRCRNEGGRTIQRSALLLLLIGIVLAEWRRSW